MCHRKKTKCELEGSNSTCVQCMRRNTQCVFPAQHEKRDNQQRYGDVHCHVPIGFLSIMANYFTVLMNMSSLWKTALSGLSRCWGRQASCKKAIWVMTTFPTKMMMMDQLVRAYHLLPVQNQISERLFAHRVGSSKVHPSFRRTKEMILDISVR